MGARETYNASVAAAAATKAATVAAAEMTRQEAINASGVNVGYNNATGNYANFNAAMKSAIVAKRDALFAAEQAKQASIAVARDTLRATSDFQPF